MDIRRARQIISSPNDVTVLYNGVSVWIDSCDETGNTCKVHLRNGKQEENVVPVSELEEI